MKEKPEQTTICAQGEELVAYLYGELGDHEAAQFRRHMEQCGSCEQELAAFGRVREDVIEWRNRSLPSFDFQQAPLYSNAEAATQKRSALAALRQFFTLAPVWMRAATAAAALAICALVAFTAIHFSERPEAMVKVTPKAPEQAQPRETAGPSTVEINRSEPQDAKEKQADVVEQRPVEIANDNNVVPRRKSRRQTAGMPVVVAQQRKATPDKARASQQARQQLAELVQSSRDEDSGLPRLSDLIDDSSGSN
ncbi:MAG TPA: zf-HC2 domain-containing protein [Pyrinomonadaceae bacterium]|jgi:hypothetical protein